MEKNVENTRIAAQPSVLPFAQTINFARLLPSTSHAAPLWLKSVFHLCFAEALRATRSTCSLAILSHTLPTFREASAGDAMRATVV